MWPFLNSQSLIITMIIILYHQLNFIQTLVHYVRKDNGQNYSYNDFSHLSGCDGPVSMKFFIDKLLSMAIIDDTLYIYQMDHIIGIYPGISWRFSPQLSGIYLMDGIYHDNHRYYPTIVDEWPLDRIVNEIFNPLFNVDSFVKLVEGDLSEFNQIVPTLWPKTITRMRNDVRVTITRSDRLDNDQQQQQLSSLSMNQSGWLYLSKYYTDDYMIHFWLRNKQTNTGFKHYMYYEHEHEESITFGELRSPDDEKFNLITMNIDGEFYALVIALNPYGQKGVYKVRTYRGSPRLNEPYGEICQKNNPNSEIIYLKLNLDKQCEHLTAMTLFENIEFGLTINDDHIYFISIDKEILFRVNKSILAAVEMAETAFVIERLEFLRFFLCFWPTRWPLPGLSLQSIEMVNDSFVPKFWLRQHFAKIDNIIVILIIIKFMAISLYMLYVCGVRLPEELLLSTLSTRSFEWITTTAHH